MLKQEESYFKWLRSFVEGAYRTVSHDSLLQYLFNTEFTYTLTMDGNRAKDGLMLRREFGIAIDRPCSVLEMMVALCRRCEESLATDDRYGDRTGQWFWNMIVNMELGTATDDRFNLNDVEFKVARMLNRDYEPNGHGGLVTLEGCDHDMREVDIWYQMMWYLDSFLEY